MRQKNYRVIVKKPKRGGMASSPKTKTDILHELFEGQLVGGTLSQLADYSELFSRMKEAVFLLDQHSLRILECNPAAVKLFKKSEEELLGETFPSFFPVTVQGLEEGLRKRADVSLDFKGDTGDVICYEISANTLKILDYIEVVQVVVSDVTDVKRAQKELLETNDVLRKLSTTDEMTGLWNFRYFKEALESVHHRACAAHESYGIIFIDVDHFKKYNDRNGHPAGDEVLRRVAHAIRTSVAHYQLAARYGGEEFVVLSRNSSVLETLATAEKIRKIIAGSDFPHGNTQPLGFVSVSVGVACYPAHGVESSDILKNADLALYQSKEEGRNRVTEFTQVLKKKKSA